MKTKITIFFTLILGLLIGSASTYSFDHAQSIHAAKHHKVEMRHFDHCGLDETVSDSKALTWINKHPNYKIISVSHTQSGNEGAYTYTLVTYEK
ncbi:MAG TPA: hypothetical protein K8V88_07885 [Companilactobacillus farciminis]|uniref:YdgH/BhsA/McbA-like domain-containing protein n=1 Tax=Companilactobacillus farciminis TaxID=1612 RepID=A0A921L9Q4_9LACO|nr:hypothetical protein [Companilactobacillus farciminis]